MMSLPFYFHKNYFYLNHFFSPNNRIDNKDKHCLLPDPYPDDVHVVKYF